jgi:Zn-finger nucleic acid-binding protein
MNCQNCGAPLRTTSNRDYAVCDYCTTVAFREPDADGVVVLGEHSALPCPICQRTLVTAFVNETDILFCDRCRGILCDQPGFGAVTQQLRSGLAAPLSTPRPLNRADLERRVMCPQCGAAMDTHPYYGPGNVVVDSCGYCRLIWLDHGELHKIVSAPGSDRPHQHA